MPLENMTGLLARLIADKMIPDVDILERGARENSLLDWSSWAPPRSAAIRQVNHRLRDGQCTIIFTNGKKAYMYYDVPRELFRQWKRVRSPGRFYHRRIKGPYSIT